jgi:L-fucono-1,5-lactonase
MIIDAHQHVWDLFRARYDWLGPSHGPIHRTLTEDEVLPELRRCGVDGVVLVQAADNAEDTAYMRATAAQHPEVVAVVGHVPLEDPAATAEQLERWAEDPLVVGVRTLIHDLPDPDFLLRPEVRESLDLVAAAGLTFDVVAVLPRHLEHVPELAARHPDLRLVVDHLAAPPIGATDVEPWWSQIGRAAAHPNVLAKVSGLYPVADRMAWSTDAVRPFVARALEVFGADRLMYGGDWPISVLAGGYTAVWDGLAPLFAELAPHEARAVLGETAVRCYGIAPARLAALLEP